MPILSNVRRIHRLATRAKASLPSLDKSSAGPTQPEFVAWPYVDTLFDFTRIAGRSSILTTGPIPQGAGRKVAIIGAGAGGMCAAFELLKCGVTPLVFEASNRIGGRAWSKHFTDQNGLEVPAFAELGSMRVPPSQKTFWKYAEELGVGTIQSAPPFPDPGSVQTRIYYQNQPLDWAPTDASPPGIFQGINEDFGNWLTSMDTQLYPTFQAWQENPSSANQAALVNIWQGFLNRYKNLSFYQSVVEAFPLWDSEKLNAFGALGVGSGGFGPLYTIGMIELLRILLQQWEDNQKQVVQGMEALPRAFYTTKVESPGIGLTSLQEQQAVSFNSKVASIFYDPVQKKPVLTFENPVSIKGTPVTELAVDAVIVATTTRSMSFMNLTLPPGEPERPVSEAAATALRNLHLTNSSKLFIRTSTKFWLDSKGQPKPGFPLTVLTDELPRAAYLLDYPNQDNGVVLLSYTWEDDSTRLQAVPAQQRFGLLRQILYKVAPEWQGCLEPVNGEIYNIDWQSEPGYYGAFKLDDPGQEPFMHSAYFQFMSVLDPQGDRGVYLAGDSNSWSGGWTEGALQTALNAATAVAKRLGGTLPDYNALTQDPRMYNYGSAPVPAPSAPTSDK